MVTSAAITGTLINNPVQGQVASAGGVRAKPHNRKS